MLPSFVIVNGMIYSCLETEMNDYLHVSLDGGLNQIAEMVLLHIILIVVSIGGSFPNLIRVRIVNIINTQCSI